MRIRISGAGCSLIDYLYTDIDLAGPGVSRYLSRNPGDGGLTPGKLVFAEEFTEYCGTDIQTALTDISNGAPPDKENLGGPAVVALINAAQLLHEDDIEIRFYGKIGSDSIGDRVIEIIEQTPLDIRNYTRCDGSSPFTIVLSDPAFDGGNGERAFINNIGSAWQSRPDDLDQSFFDSDIVLFGGTGLVPHLHDGITELCSRSRRNGCLTIVNTVFDFRSEKKAPDKRWPLGKDDSTYSLIDLLIVDREEARRMSGTSTPEKALDWFRNKGVAAAIVTCGVDDIHLYASGSFFRSVSPTRMPVCKLISEDIQTGHFQAGDTTGCGDNFVGGVLASIAGQAQAESGLERLDLRDAVAWGAASGGFTCLYVGGTYIEKTSGEKRSKIERYYNHYKSHL